MKKFTVIVLSYQNFQWMNECLDSLLMQDYEDVQLILADDGSDDFPREALASYVASRRPDLLPQLTFCIARENQGTVKNINRALEKAQGDYLLILSIDDALAHANVLSRFAQSFAGSGEDVMAVTSQAMQYDRDMCKALGMILTPAQERMLSDGDTQALFGALCLHCFWVSGATAYRRTFFETNGAMDESFRLIEDWPLFLRIARLRIPFRYEAFLSLKHRAGGVSSAGATESPTQEQYQTDLMRVMEQEILPYVSSAPEALRSQIATQCRDKRILYQWRRHKRAFGAVRGAAWLLCHGGIAVFFHKWRDRRIRGENA